MSKSSGLYYARTGAIKSYDYAEFEIELGFRIKIVVGLKLLFGIPKLREDYLRERAKRCLVVLLGGRKVLLEVPPEETMASVYAFRKSHLDYTLEIGSDSVVDVAKIMKELYNKNFEVNYLVDNILKLPKNKDGETE